MAEILSPISGGIQVARSSVSSSTFGIGRGALQPVRSEPDPETLKLLRENKNSFSLISDRLESLSIRMVNFRDSLEKISTLILNDSFLERQKESQNQAQENQLAEQQLREGKESIIEKRIQSALVQPVQKVGEKVTSVLGSLMGFFTTLLGGWLLNQGIETIKAFSEDNKTKLEQIKDDTLGQLGIIGRVFTILKTGFFGLIKTMTSLTGKIVSAVTMGLFINPFKSLLQGITGRGGNTGGGGGKGPRVSGGIGSLVGRIATLAQGLMNYFNGENIDAVLAAATLFGPGRIIKIAAGLGYTADEIAELFGSNIFGEDPKKLKQAREIKEEAEKESKKTSKISSDEKESSSSKSSINPSESIPSPTPSPVNAESSSQVALSSISMMPGSKSSVGEEKSNITQIYGFGNNMNEKPETAVFEPIKSKSTQEKMESVGKLDEPSPNIIMLPEMQQPGIIQKTSAASGRANNVPSIQTSNPENFYVLYSQVQYNVVM